MIYIYIYFYKKQQVLTDGRRKKPDERITLKATESNSMKKGEEREKENTCPASKRADIMSDSFQPAELQQSTSTIYTYNKIRNINKRVCNIIKFGCCWHLGHPKDGAQNLCRSEARSDIGKPLRA